MGATHLVLGASGFVGRHVVQCLVADGHNVVTAGRTPLPPASWNFGITHIPFDTETGDWDALTACCDVLHHYAWTQTAEAGEELRMNVAPAIALLQSMQRQRCKRLLFMSSGGTVYGRLREIPAPESHPLEPISAYGASKVAIETYIRMFCVQHGIDGRIARLANPFGAGQDAARGQGAVAAFLDRALKGEQAVIWGDGGVVRDYIHVSDAAKALTRQALATPDAANQVLNIGSGHGHSLNDILAAIGSLTGRPLDVKYCDARATDVPVSILDIRRAKDILKWTPALSFAQGLKRTLDDLRAGRSVYSSFS
jgi:UDP-glucose 4-epimerase